MWLDYSQPHNTTNTQKTFISRFRYMYNKIWRKLIYSEQSNLIKIRKSPYNVPFGVVDELNILQIHHTIVCSIECLE